MLKTSIKKQLTEIPMQKMDRRESTTSNSSIEPMDLGRTQSNVCADIKKETNRALQLPTLTLKDAILSDANTKLNASHESDGDESDDRDRDHPRRSHSQHHYHHRRRGNSGRDKRTVHLECTDSPHSLRKKFRFSSNQNIPESVINMKQKTSNNDSALSGKSSTTANLTATTNNNESGFVDASSSHVLNTSASSATSSGSSSSSSPTSSTSASPSASNIASVVSSPESGMGERDDMKYLCPICEVVSATPHEFTNHIRCHNYSSGDTENFTCRICSKVLSSASSLDRHVLVHTGERPFNCKYCQLTFTTNGNMHRHMRTHKQHQQHYHRNSNGTKGGGGSGTSGGGGGGGGSAGNGGTSSMIPVLPSTDQLAGAPTTAASGVMPSKTSNVSNGVVINGNGDTIAGGGGSGGGGGGGGGGGESYESDGGCSTDSSSAISQSSNNNNNNNTNNKNISNFKRKSTDSVDDMAVMKRRVKTTINNNNIIDNAHAEKGMIEEADVIDDMKQQQQQQQKLFCPVCNRNDFVGMLALDAHMDCDHSDIPAKCRYCDVVFKTHKQLNVHPCTSKQKTTPGFKDLTFVDFSSEKFPLIAKSVCEQSLRTPVSNQKFECPKCYRAFPCASAVEIHEKDCSMSGKNLNMDAHDFSTRKHRTYSESSGGMDDDETGRREEFFARLYLKNKSAAQSMTSLSASSPSLSDVKSSELDKTPIKMSQFEQYQDSKELADIQSILNLTSSSSTSNFLRNFENSVNAPISNYGAENGEEEAQDAFTSEFRKMKLRGEFPCKLCTAVFPNLRALKGHNRIHLSAAGPGPYRCNMCTYSIHDKAALVRHMRTHNGDRPYECGICNYAFTTKANCERHLRNRHAKTTRDEVKRAIIYHPSEDSNCDDAMKKLHMFSSPEFDDDMEQNHPPKDRSTPVSHLKEMLQAESKPLKIQVKSLEKLIDKAATSFSHSDEAENENEVVESPQEKPRPIDLSMDALDLSKKPLKMPKVEEKPPQSPNLSQTAPSRIASDEQNIDIRTLEKNRQLLLEQQRILSEAMSKMNPAHYLQLTELYRNLVFPPPFFLQNSFLSNNINDQSKFAPMMSSLFEHAGNPQSASSSSNATMQPKSEESSLLMKQSNSRPHSPIPAKTQLLPRNITPSSAQMPLIPRSHHHMGASTHPSGILPSSVANSGPVKMVIKNGVLMPKQKQRRYRTERPFACEHCSARFTLRSNMERHIKQQHPQYWAQRQRSGHHIMRGRASNSVLSHMQSTHPPMEPAHPMGSGGMISNTLSAISDQVKYAILAQQLKARKDTDILQQALSQGSSSVLAQNPSAAISNLRKSLSSSSNTNNGSIEDDDPKLVIDEDDEKDEDEEEDEDEDRKPDNLAKLHEFQEQNTIEAAKKVAESILEQAMKAGGTKNPYSTNTVDDDRSLTKDFGLKLSNNMIAQAESVGKILKEVASSRFKDESNDLASVSRLVDNATNSMSFNSYFRSDVVNQMEQSDEEGLVASGSASESNNSGPEDMAGSQEPKKKSAYSSAPNRVSCPYCQRMFPWSSSLRRHILTHTGQKPFKCSHCPLLFTTKSNCDRHLLRKHGNVESAVSLYVPIEDVNEPLPVPKSVEEIELQQQQQLLQQQQQLQQQKKLEEQKELEKIQPPQQKQTVPEQQEPTVSANSTPAASAVCKVEPIPQIVSSSELPFKCHLCDSSFAERLQCLDHIKIHHAQEFSLLLSKGAIDNEADVNSQVQSTEDDEKRDESRGKYPDYTNRKVICAFCVRRFWSTEDLRRHMRTHSGERPFQCDICLRKFTLKHSMLRHMKKHSNGGHSGNGAANAANSGSDDDDDEQPPTSVTLATSLRSHTIQEIFSKATSEWRNNRLSGEHKENIEEHNNQSDLIGNLLGISDQGILNKLLSSADEAAKFLGVDK